MMMHSRKDRAKRTVIAFVLVFALSFTSVFAAGEPQTESTGDTAAAAAETGTGVSQDASVDDATAGSGEQGEGGEEQTDEPQTEEPEPEPDPTPAIIRKGKYYYYQNADGTIRKKAGFVKLDGRIYYIRRGGRIRAGELFRVGKKYYRAGRNGAVETGVYKWGRNLYFAYSNGSWKRKPGFVTWNGKKYYIGDDGSIITGDGFVVKNVAYVANKKGRVTKVDLSGDSNAVIKIARKQVGIMTGMTYWVWYYRTRFIDTDRTPWCGAFVAWVYNKAGLYNKISVARRYGALGYVPSYSRFADSYGKWIRNKDARAGDIIVFGRNRHVGLVDGVYGKYIVTIEGNAGPTAVIGCRKPGAVVRKIYRLSDKDIKGVIRVLKHKSG